MRFCREHLTLYAVTDRACLGARPLADAVEVAIRGGVTMVQLREKSLEVTDRRLFLSEAEELARICRKYGVPFIVNDDVEVALESRADGVHLGQDDTDAREARRILGNDAVIGVTARSVDEAVAAETAGADYIGVGAVFGTATKMNTRHIGVEGLRAITSAVHTPAVAIGGVNISNIDKLKDSGASGVAVVSAIFGAPDIESACRELRRAAGGIL